LRRGILFFPDDLKIIHELLMFTKTKTPELHPGPSRGRVL
jgi:hypothetical protein